MHNPCTTHAYAKRDMSGPLIAAIVWVFVATGTAFLPMRRQLVPGVLLIIAAPVIIVWMGLVYGVLIATAGVAAFVSMFRKPLAHLARKTLRRTT